MLHLTLDHLQIDLRYVDHTVNLDQLLPSLAMLFSASLFARHCPDVVNIDHAIKTVRPTTLAAE